MIVESTYNPRWYLRNPDLQTMVPTLFRKREQLPYVRERLETPDGDFLDLDWHRTGSDRLVVISHGLEGYSRSVYVLGMANAFVGAGYDVLAWNFRGCSGEPNRLPASYHSGKSEDLRLVMNQVLETTEYQSIALVGFSIGGNITLKYLGEEGRAISSRVTSAVTFSVPCHLESSAYLLGKKRNRIYMKRFLVMLNDKMIAKEQQNPGILDLDGISGLKNFLDFDERFTAPLNGFDSAVHYWSESSSIGFIDDITVPTLLVSAADDSFLSPECYPYKLAQDHSFFHLEVPKRGGHVGFIQDDIHGVYWSEQRAVEFALNVQVSGELDRVSV